jgi:RHS repeat-associated protein
MLGSPRVITDSFGNVAARRDFRPFGEQVSVDGNYRSASFYASGTADNIRQKFTGYQKDNETNLDFAEARMYENRHGRFTAVDPLLASGKSANPQSFNRFTYVLNNPLAFTDPSGLQVTAPTEDIVVRINTWINKAGEYITRTVSWEGQSYTTRERNPIPQGFLPTEIFQDPESVEAIRMRRGNVILDSISPKPQSRIVFPWGTPEDVDKSAATLSSLDLSGTFDIAWTGYRHRIGQASDTDLAISYGMFGTNFIPSFKGSKLTKNMIESGIERPFGSYATHHIVAIFDRRASEARAILEKAGIGINDAVNGVFLPATKKASEILGGTAHSTIHTNEYFKVLTNRLRKSQNIQEELKLIREEILNGTFPK